MVKIKKTIVDHADWFRAVQGRSKGRYFVWDKDRFWFGLEIDSPKTKQLQGHNALSDKIWAPLPKLYLGALDDIAKEVRASENRIEQMIAAFEANQDWTTLIDDSRSERDALAQRMKSIHAKAVNKMKALATKTWAIESRRDVNLATAKWRITVDDTVHPAGIGLCLGKLRVSRSTDLRTWQGALKDCVKACLDVSRLGRVLDKAESEMRAELSGLVAILKQEDNAATKVAQKLSTARQSYHARILVVCNATEKALKALNNARAVTATTRKQCRLKKAVDQIHQSEKELVALGKRIEDVQERCTTSLRHDVMVASVQDSLSAISDQVVVDNTVKLLRTADTSIAKSASKSAGVWDDIGKIATKAMGSVVNANKIFARQEAQLKRKPGDIDVSFVG